MNREDEITGREFDWFAIDINNDIAVFSTAGSGNASQTVLNNYEEHDSISETLETENWGSENVWNDLANYGFYVFDWKLNQGPYIRKITPARNLSKELKTKIKNINGIPLLKLVFSETEETKI